MSEEEGDEGIAAQQEACAAEPVPKAKKRRASTVSKKTAVAAADPTAKHQKVTSAPGDVPGAALAAAELAASLDTVDADPHGLFHDGDDDVDTCEAQPAGDLPANGSGEAVESENALSALLGDGAVGCEAAPSDALAFDEPDDPAPPNHAGGSSAVAIPGAPGCSEFNVPPGCTINNVVPVSSSSHWIARLPHGEKHENKASCTKVYGRTRSEQQAKLIVWSYLWAWWAEKNQSTGGGA